MEVIFKGMGASHLKNIGVDDVLSDIYFLLQ